MQQNKIEDNYRQTYSPWMQQSSRSHNTHLNSTNSGKFSLYATIHLNKKEHLNPQQLQTRRTLKNMLKQPYRRISKVDHMIMSNKAQQVQSNTIYKQSNTIQLKPKFKIKSINNANKNKSHLRFLSSLDYPTVKLKNIGIDGIQQRNDGEEQEKRGVCNIFQENYKNKCKINRKISKNVGRSLGEASLLDRLNRISLEKPIHRYKSRAFGESTRITPFFNNNK